MPGKNKVAVFDLTVSKTFEVESEGEDESKKSEKENSEED